MNKHFDKELMTKKNNQDFENSTKYQICYNDCVDNEVKVRGHCHIIGKDRGSAHRDRNINVKLNHKISVAFHNLKNYYDKNQANSVLKQTSSQIDQKNSSTINNKLIFIDSFQ